MLRDLKRRGMRPAVVAVGDAAFGFWAAYMAQARWRHRRRTLLPLVRKDVVFANGVQQEGKARRTKARAA